jgi:PAS domain S-box-containing protein
LATQLEVSIDGILVVDTKGKILSSNKRFANLWGIPINIIETKSDERTLQSLIAEKLENPEEYMRIVKHIYEKPDETSQDEIFLKDGRTFDRYLAPMLGADGKHFGRVWYFRDVTERKRAEVEKEKLEEQLRGSQKMEAVGRLAGGVAHDFNNLLSVILSYTGFAMKGTREGDPIKDDLLEVKKAAERAAELTRQLLAFGRKQVLQPVPLDLNQVALGIEKMLRRIIGEDIEFVQQLSPNLGVVRADRGQIEQVLMNLVINARDAMIGGGKLTIETSNVDLDAEYASHHADVIPGPYVQLAVSDTGSGMDEKTQEKIFEPFFTTKEKGKGTGLGLATVHGIVKQSGGNIWFYSEKGHGTTFKIYFPRDMAATVKTIQPSIIPQQATGNETILVVEDEDALLRVAKRTLDAVGYQVVTAVDGDDALKIYANHKGGIQLLLTDVVMPKMSGFELAQELLKKQPDLKVLYMSGYTDNVYFHHGMLDGGVNFIGKPFTEDTLTLKVRKVLDGIVLVDVDGEKKATEADTQKKARLLDVEALRTLDSDTLEKLRKAVMGARYDMIVETVESLRVTKPDLAAEVRRLADLFDYEGLRNLLGVGKA